MRDRYLDQAVLELLKYDERVRGLDVQVSYDGGVAHLSGEVDTGEQLRTLRELVGRLDGTQAVWDRVRVAGREPVLVDVGCGGIKQYPESIGVDIRETGGVDVVADVRERLPFGDGSVDRVFAVHVLEHLIDFLPLVDECHRVLRPGGVLHVLSPWWGFVNAVADPTHVRLLDVQTFKGICDRPGSPRRWNALHASCDGASIFGDLTPRQPGEEPPDPAVLARFFD